MSRGVVLSTVRGLMKAHTHDVQETNSALDTSFNYHLESVQLELCAAYDWPFLNDSWDVNIVAGTYYYNFPTSNIRGYSSTINFERPVKVYRYFNSQYEEICHGIFPDEEYNCQDSALGEAMDPVQKWQIDTNTGDTTNPDQFEVWPVPVTAQKVRFVGQKSPRAFASDSDKSELDSLLLALFAAANYLQLRSDDNAPLVLAKAQKRLAACRAGLTKQNQQPLVLGKNLQLPPQPRRVSVVAIAP